jgi:hypothetical protein
MVWTRVSSRIHPSRDDRPTITVPMIQEDTKPYNEFCEEFDHQLKLPFCAIDFETWRDFNNPVMCSFLIALTDGKKVEGVVGATITGKLPDGKLMFKANPKAWGWDKCDKHLKCKKKEVKEECPNCKRVKPKSYGKYFTKYDNETRVVKVIKGWCWADELDKVIIPLLRKHDIFTCYAHNATVDIIAMLHCLLPDLSHPLEHFSQAPTERGKLLMRGSKILSAPIDLAPTINESMTLGKYSRKAYNYKEKKFETYYDYPFKFLDSVALMPLPLAVIGYAIGYPKEKTPEIFTNDDHKDFGNFMAITDANVEYAVMDCEILFQGMRSFWNVIKEIGYHGSTLPLTAGTLGMQMIAAANVLETGEDKKKATLYKKKKKSWKYASIVNNPEMDDICRRAMVGGRTQVFNNAVIDDKIIYGTDANAMYPSVLTKVGNSFPDFRNMHLFDDPSTIDDDCINNMEGTIYVHWERPNWDSIGLFAVKPKVGGLDWTQQQGTRWITLLEYRYAKSKGYPLTILVDEEVGACAIICSRLKYNPFLCVKKWYDKRLEMKKANDPREFIIKILMNAGSFGKHVEKNQAQIITTEDEWGMSDLDDWDFRAITEVDGEVFGYATEQDFTRSDTTANVMGCYITAHARIDLYEVMHEIGIKHMIYTDTDSAKHTNESIMCPKEGDGLCEWKLEQKYDYWHSVAPKQYKYHAIWDEKAGNCAKWDARIKGCSIKSAAALENMEYSDFCQHVSLTGVITFERVIGLKESWLSEKHSAGDWIVMDKNIGG